MEELKEYEIINNQKSAKQKLPFIIAISIVVIAIIVAVVFLITKKNTNIDSVSVDEDEKEYIFEEDEDFDFTETLAELELPEESGLDDVYDKIESLKELGEYDEFADDDSEETLANYIYPKTNFLTTEIFDDIEIDFPYSFFPNYTYRSANLIQETVTNYFKLTNGKDVEFVEGSLKGDYFNVKVGNDEIYTIRLDSTDNNGEKEVDMLTIISPNNKEIFSYDGRFYIEQ